MKNGIIDKRSKQDQEDFKTRRRRKRSYSDGYLTVPPNFFQQLQQEHALRVKDCESKPDYFTDNEDDDDPNDDDVATNNRIKNSDNIINVGGNKNKHGLISDFKRFVTTKMLTKRRSAHIDVNVPLRFAIRSREIERVRHLLETSHVDVNMSNDRGITVLHEAAFDGYIDILKLLIEHGADINKPDNEGYTCLDYAVFCGHFECSSYLIDHGAKDDHIRNGITAFKMPTLT